MVDKEILEALSELSDADTKKVSYRKKHIKCGKESCQSCPHGPYWYAEWSDNGVRKSKYLGKNIDAKE